MVQKVDDAFEELNSGVADEEPEDAGPGMMGHILLSLSHVKEIVAAVHSPRSPGIGTTLTTPSGVETSQHESKAVNLKDSSHNVESKVGEDPQVQSLSDPHHHHTADLDSAVDGASPEEASLSVVPVASAESGRSLWEGATASSRSPLGERIMTLLPGCNTNPYSVSSPTRPHADSPHTVGQNSVVPTSPSIQGSAPSSPGVFGKLELITHLAERLHLQKKSSSPRAAIESSGTPTTNTSASASANASVPSPTTGGPSSTIDTATSATVD